MNHNWSKQIANTYKNKFLLNEQSPWNFEDPYDIERQLLDLPRDVEGEDPAPQTRSRPRRTSPQPGNKNVIPPEKTPPRIAPAPEGLRVENPNPSTTGSQGPRRGQPDVAGRIRPGGVVERSPSAPKTPTPSKTGQNIYQRTWDTLSKSKIGQATGKALDAAFGTGLVPEKTPPGVKDLIGKFGGPLGIALTGLEYKQAIEAQQEKAERQQRTGSNDGTQDAIETVINPTNLTAAGMVGAGTVIGAAAGGLGLGGLAGAGAGAAAGAGIMAAGVLPAVVGVGGLAVGGLAGREMLDRAASDKSNEVRFKINKDVVDNLKKTPGVDRVALEKAQAALDAQEKEMRSTGTLDKVAGAVAGAYDTAATLAGSLYGAATSDNKTGEELKAEQEELARKGLQQSGGKVVAAPGRKTQAEMKAEEDRVAKEALARANKRTPEQVQADIDADLRNRAKQRIIDQQQMEKDIAEYEANAKR